MAEWNDIHSIYFTKANNIKTSLYNLIGITHNGYFIEIINPEPYKSICLQDAQEIVLSKESSYYILKIIDDSDKVISYKLNENITLTEEMVSATKFLQFMVNCYSDLIELRSMDIFDERILRRRIDESDVDDAYDSTFDNSESDFD
uniref:DUF727 domain-containing protein n=1 Tax=Parastrongyloides trichosuri TaxID=131310 RepID=A0A0N5A4A4_PARTI